MPVQNRLETDKEELNAQLSSLYNLTKSYLKDFEATMRSIWEKLDLISTHHLNKTLQLKNELHQIKVNQENLFKKYTLEMLNCKRALDMKIESMQEADTEEELTDILGLSEVITIANNKINKVMGHNFRNLLSYIDLVIDIANHIDNKAKIISDTKKRLKEISNILINKKNHNRVEAADTILKFIAKDLENNNNIESQEKDKQIEKFLETFRSYCAVGEEENRARTSLNRFLRHKIFIPSSSMIKSSTEVKLINHEIIKGYEDLNKLKETQDNFREELLKIICGKIEEEIKLVLKINTLLEKKENNFSISEK